MKSIDSIVGVYIDDLFDTLEEKIGEEKVEKLLKEKIFTNEKIIFDKEFGHLIFKSNEVNNLSNIFNVTRVELNLKSLSEVVELYQCSQDFGIKEYDVLNFHYDEVYEQLIMYFDDSSNTDEIWNDIKLNGLENFLERKYKEQTRIMIKNRLKELEEYAENGEIEIW